MTSYNDNYGVQCDIHVVYVHCTVNSVHCAFALYTAYSKLYRKRYALACITGQQGAPTLHWNYRQWSNTDQQPCYVVYALMELLRNPGEHATYDAIFVAMTQRVTQSMRQPCTFQHGVGVAVQLNKIKSEYKNKWRIIFAKTIRYLLNIDHLKIKLNI